MNMEEKVLTREQVEILGFDEVSVITADMLKGYTAFGNRAFCGCSGLTSITIPDSITSIGCWVFSYCTGLTSITIPDSVTSIGTGVFGHCTGLTTIKIPNSITRISGSAFRGCIGLKSLTIPNRVTSIESDAFKDCIGLTSIEIPDSVIRIGWCAFEGCGNLASIIFRGKTYANQVIRDGKCKAYKGFYPDMTCRGFQYEEGKTYEFDGEPILCHCGFHACLNLADVFSYYDGTFGGDMVIREVELEGVCNERRWDSKVVAKKITIGKRIL